MEMIGTIFGVIVAVVLLGGLYFLPSIFAIMRGHPSKVAIIILNTLLGWSFIAWVVAIVWAFTDTRRA